MNKQEAINKLKSKKILENFLSNYGLGYNEALDEAIYIINQIDEPEKPAVPQFVADWYEEHKDNFEFSVQCLCVQSCEPVRQIDTWFDFAVNKPIETLVKMKLFGYEVEKEKLYTVEIPNPNSKGNNKIYLCKDDTTDKVYLCKGNFNPSKNRNLRLTESEIRKDFEWAWPFAK